MHISHEAGILEDPDFPPPENIFTRTTLLKNTPDEEDIIEIHFKDGFPTKVVNRRTNTVKTDPLELFIYLNELGTKHGIGIVDMVENRYIGIKSRGVYETPGATILWKAHEDIEGIAMDKEVMYNGYWFSPEMDFLMAAFEKAQEAIDGVVTLKLFKGNVVVMGRKSPTSLYDQDLSSMEVEGGFDPTDSTGFININAIRLKAHNLVLKKRNPYEWRRRFK